MTPHHDAEADADAAFIAAFEVGTPPASGFHHAEHVRLAWLYLRRMSPAQALARFCEGLQHFAKVNGADGLYHETITWTYLLLINERMRRQPETSSWQEFAERNPDLLSWEEPILKRYYSAEILGSDVARQTFVFPDRAP